LEIWNGHGIHLKFNYKFKKCCKGFWFILDLYSLYTTYIICIHGIYEYKYFISYILYKYWYLYLYNIHIWYLRVYVYSNHMYLININIQYFYILYTKSFIFVYEVLFIWYFIRFNTINDTFIISWGDTPYHLHFHTLSWIRL